MKFDVCSGTKSKEARTIIQMIQKGGKTDGGDFGTVTTWTGELLECGRLFFWFRTGAKKAKFLVLQTIQSPIQVSYMV